MKFIILLALLVALVYCGGQENTLAYSQSNIESFENDDLFEEDEDFEGTLASEGPCSINCQSYYVNSNRVCNCPSAAAATVYHSIQIQGACMNLAMVQDLPSTFQGQFITLAEQYCSRNGCQCGFPADTRAITQQ